MDESAPERKITRADLEAEFQSLVDDGQETLGDASRKAVGIAGAFGFLALVLTYVLGRRRGSKAKAQVEIRRI
jgi:hypothetical protein